MRSLAAILAILMAASLPAHAQSSGGGGSSGGSPAMGGGTGESSRLGTPGGGTAPGSSGGAGQAQDQDQPQQSQVPDICTGPNDAPQCAGIGEPTGSLGDRGINQGERRRYGPDQSPVQGGPSFESPMGQPLNLPREGR